MRRNVTYGIGPRYPWHGYSSGRLHILSAGRMRHLLAHMNSPNPYIAFDLSDLAPLCAQRVGRLRAKDWTTPAERDLLREDTALLLDAVAQQLGTSSGTQPADAITLGELVNSIEYGPLSNSRRTQVDGGRRSR